MVSDDGFWEGNIGFQYSRAIYVLTINNFIGTAEDIRGLVANGINVMREVGRLGYNRTLAINMAYWMVFVTTTEVTESVQSITMTGSPEQVFDRRYLKTGLANEAGICDVNALSTDFDYSNGLLKIRYSYQQYNSSQICRNIALPEHLGYVPFIDHETFKLDIDVRSLMTVMAVNTGILGFFELQIIPNTYREVEIDGLVLSYDLYYFPTFPNMAPFYCTVNNVTGDINDSNSSAICTLSIGNFQALPVFEHVGKNYEQPTPCSCGSEIVSFCNYFNFLSGLIFYEFNNSEVYKDNTFGYADIFRLAKEYDFSLYQLNSDAFNASWDAAIGTNIYKDDREWRRRSYEFCSNATSRGCSFLSVLLSESDKQSVSEYYYQIRYGACNDTMSISQSATQKLIDTIPINPEELYFECRRTPLDSLYAAFGVTVGNIMLLRFGLMVFLMGFLMLQRQWFKFLGAPNTFTTFEKNKVLQFFAFQLLLARDAENDAAEPANGSIVKQLQQELGSIEKTERFFSSRGPDTVPLFSSDDNNTNILMSNDGQITRNSSNAFEIEENGANRGSNTYKSESSRSSKSKMAINSTTAAISRARRNTRNKVYHEVLENPLQKRSKSKI